MRKDLLKFVIAVGILIFVALVFLRGDEDSWICKDGKWQKHGNPSKPAPIEVCK